MSESLPNIFGVETTDVKPPKLPTIAQFVKQNKEPKSKPLDSIQIVWIPGKFDNYTLQTGKYRVIITPNHPFFQALGILFRDEGVFATPMSIRITDWKNAKYQLEESKGDNRVYKPLGTAGYKLQTE